MKLKPGVRVDGIQPELLIALAVADGVYREITGAGCTVTSVRDGSHSVRGMHPAGLAADLRTRDVPATERSTIQQHLAAALGDDYDVVLEADHIHLEFDPADLT